MSRHYYHKFILCMILLLGVFVLIFLPHQDYGLLEVFKERDFAAYWSAFQLFIRGENPYSHELLLVQEKLLKPDLLVPNIVWNPPWLFTIMYPVFYLEFKTAALAWLILNLIFVGVASILTWKTFSDEDLRLAPCLLAGIFSLPICECLAEGQLSLMITASVIGFIWAIENRHDILAGACMVIPTIKPHLIYLLVVYFALWLIFHRRWGVIISTVLFLAVLIGVTEVCFAHVVSSWIHMQDSPLTWKAVSVITPIRTVVAHFTGSIPTWPTIAIPLMCALATSFIYIRVGLPSKISKAVPPLLCLSLFSAPYGWFFDQALLLIVQVALVAKAYAPTTSARGRFNIILLLILLQLATIIFAQYAQSWEYYFWYPLAFWGVWCVSVSGRINKLRDRSAAVFF